MTKRILGGHDRKLLLTRGFQNLASGHHNMPDERPVPEHGRVLHYKWNVAVLEDLAERIGLRARTGYIMGAGIRALSGLLAAARADSFCRLPVARAALAGRFLFIGCRACGFIIDEHAA